MELGQCFVPVDKNKTWQLPGSVTPTAYPTRYAGYLSAIALYNQLPSRHTRVQSEMDIFN